MDKLEIEDTKKRFKFLLGSENGVLFRKFIEGQKHPAHIEAIIKVQFLVWLIVWDFSFLFNYLSSHYLRWFYRRC